MRTALLLALFLSTSPAGAAWGDFDHDFEDEKKPWNELETQLPAPPRADRLVRFEVSPAVPHAYFLDPEAISSGEDGVVRYTVVVRTAGGAENVSFEGMRCATAERKIYAFGRPGGGWSRNKHARWEPIRIRLAASYQRELFFHYLCTVDGTDMRTIRRAIANGGIRRGGD